MLATETLLACATAPAKNSRHWTQGEISWGKILQWAPARTRECGSYVLGTIEPSTETHSPGGEPCTARHRNKATVTSRSALTLDVDSASPEWLDEWLLLWVHEALVHTTYHSTLEAPRYRLIIPLARPVSPDEYTALAEYVIDGDPAFDPSTVQPERYMFKPSAENPENYRRAHVSGPVLDPGEVLDLAGYQGPPVSSEGRRKASRRDPLELQGVPGAFNRVYTDLAQLVAAYGLPYDHVGGDRWTLRGSESPAGMGPVHGAEHLWFSHHSTDPAGGRACSAFDLARLHLFGELDSEADPSTPVNRLPSHGAMCDRAVADAAVVRELFGSDFDDISTDQESSAEGETPEPPPDGWLTRLKISRTGDTVDSVQNLDLIAANDRLFQGLAYNEMTLAVEADWLPWRDVGRNPDLSEADMAALWLHMERQYRLKTSQARLSALVSATALKRSRHPVREYLMSLEWDGVPRMEESLPGVTPTDYTRFVARKCLVGAAARMLDPGCKVDQVLILQGGEGLGKTSWIEKMSRGWFSQLGDIHSKDTLLHMQRSWLVVADEGYWLKKSDASALKDFITRTSDTFRTPYDRHSRTHKRHTSIWGSVNERAVLREQEGNRRFLVVHCETKMNFDRMTPDYIDQVWAEAVAAYRAGERLWLTAEEEAWCRDERETFIADTGRFGVVQEYLRTLVPENWEYMPLEARQAWLSTRSDDLAVVGTRPITRVCAVQLWAEALGHRMSDTQNPGDMQELREIMDRMPGWTAVQRKQRVPQYGVQRAWERG